MSSGPPPEVADFLERLPDDQREALLFLREVIASVVPDATESVNYGVPAFKLDGRPLVSYGAGKSHCAFYVQSPAVMEAHAADLEGHEQGKGSVRFDPSQPLASDLVTKLVRARIDEVRASKR